MVHFFRLGLATILLFIFSASVFSQTDTTAPTVSSATVNGTALVITFDETLAAASLANSAFAVKKTPSGGSEQTASLSGSPSISAATVTLTLADVVAHNDTGVKVSYTKPTSGSNNKLQDAADNEVTGFTDRAVTNNTAQAPAPTNLAAGNTTGNYTYLTWDEPADDGNGVVGGYNVYRCAVPDGGTTCTPVWLAWVMPNWYTYYGDSGLSAGATYRYAVGSSRGAGTDSDWSNVVTVMTLPQAPAPTGLTVTATTTTSISLGWTAPADDGKGAITGYNVYSCEEGMTACTPVWVAWVDGASTTSYTHSGLTEATEYRYAVGASRGDGTESVFSDQVTATAQAPDTTAPTFSSATVDGTALVITFNETLAQAASLANSAFAVKKTPSGGSEQTASLSGSPSISGATVTLTLAAAAVHTDTGVKVSYTKPASGSNNKLQDAAANEVTGFTDRAVTNETADPTAPAVSSATVDGTALVITFNETLAPAASLANSAFAVKKTPAGGSEQTASLSGSPSISGATVTLTLAAAAVHNDTGVKVSYTKPTSGSNNKLQDAADNEVADFTDRAVTNNTADTTAPTFSSATVDRTALVITFDETLAPAPNLANGAFTVKKTPSGGSEQTASLSGSPSISAATVTLTLADVVAHNDTGVKVSYTKPTSGSNNKLQDAADNEVTGFTDRAVTNNTAQAPAPTNLAAGNTTGNYTYLTWDEPADDGNGVVGGYNVYRCAVPDGGTTCTPVWLAWAMPNWYTYYGDSGLSAGATYRYAVGSSRGAGTDSDWSNVVTVMTLPQAPAPTGLTVTATTTTSISLGWTAPADDGKGAITGYNVYSCEEGMTACTPVWVAWVDGASTTSYTHSGLTEATEYRYAVGASRGYGTESVFSDQVTATAQAPDTTAPTFSSATVDGTALVITFNETLAQAASLANSAFAVKKTPSGGSEQTASLSGSPSISGATVTLTLAAAAVHTDTGVKVSYTKPASGSNNKLQDAAANEVTGFTDRAVTNETADPTAPAVSSATVDGTALVITFNETLAPAASLANSAFAVKKTPAGGSEQTASLSGSPSISGATVTLTLAAAAVHNDTGVKVSYTKPTSGSNNKLQDAADNEVADFTDRAVTNNTADTTAPTFSSATVDRTALVITFDETLAPAPNLANGAFTVKKTPSGGSEQTASLSGSPSISAATVTLTLADVVAHNDTGVKVSYTKPTSGSNNKLQDAADNEVTGFTDRAVTNNTAQAPAPTNLAAGNTTGNYTYLTWDEPADDGNGVVGGYNVYRCAVPDGGTTCTPVWLAWVMPNWYTYYGDSGLSAGATYRYAVGSSRGAGTDSDWSNVVTVMTLPAGTLALNLDAITGDNTVNIAEKAAGFSISGDTGSETPLTDTTDAGGNWSVDVPADASYITGASVTVTVSAAKTGYTAPGNITHTLTIDLGAPTAPTYSAPTSLTVGTAITNISPAGGSGIDGYRATGLPAGLSINSTTGIISGTPTTANAGTAGATVTAFDSAGNTDTVDITFPAVAEAGTDQTAKVVQTPAPPPPPIVIRVIGLKATAVSADSISLGWKLTVKDVMTTYSVYRCTVPEDESTCDPYDGLWLANLENTNVYTDTKVTSGETYRYAVAVEPYRREELSGAITVVAQMPQMPAAPTGLMVTEVDESSVRLRWTAPEDDGGGPVQSIDIYRCNVDRSPDCSEFLYLTSRNPALTEYKDNDVESGTTYRYAVAAYRSGDEVSPWSDQVTATADAGTTPPTGRCTVTTCSVVRKVRRPVSRSG